MRLTWKNAQDWMRHQPVIVHSRIFNELNIVWQVPCRKITPEQATEAKKPPAHYGLKGGGQS